MNKVDTLKIALYKELSKELANFPEVEDIRLLDVLFKNSAIQSLFVTAEEDLTELYAELDAIQTEEAPLDMSGETTGDPNPLDMIHEVTEDMIVEVAPRTTLSRFEGWLTSIDSYRSTLH